GVLFGGAMGAAGGYWISNPAAFAINAMLTTPYAQVGILATGATAATGAGTNWNYNFSWTTAAGGGGSYNLNGPNTTPEQIGDRSITEARASDFYNNSGEIRQWNPSWVDKWSESKNFFGNLSYDLVDGVAVTLQSFVLGSESRHINGTGVIGNDRTDAFVNTIQWGIPTSGMYGQYSRSAGKSLVNIVTSNPKFRLQIHQHSISPLKGSGAAGSMKPWHININKHHFIFNPMNWKYFYPWWPW
ncbi:MAG: hypothetical protein Q8R96_18065, partial [Bacteroidota bacterium]|nr:hypothetical protein [Bacteroidota bacterium]